MSNRNATECPFCENGIMHQESRDQQYTYQDHTLLIQQPGIYCNSCDESILEAKHLKATRVDLQAFRARVDGLLGPVEIKRIRKKIGLNQQQAGELFGGGKNAFSRYELGEVALPKSVSVLFSLFSKHPELIDDVKDMQS
ncbi:MAG: HTH-type transcriptional regulator/antitoxin MqsA [Phenylobacterium sp.]|jgi:HTH-type transcriptional regulator/antitoxin MqsA